MIRSSLVLSSLLLCLLVFSTSAQAQGDLRQVQVACEVLAGSGNTVITCPAGSYVYIANAFWGRRDTSTCAAPGAAGLPTDASTLCMGAGTTLYPAIAAACNASPSSTCIVSEPSIDVLGTPSQLNSQSCDSIRKYLEITYYCVSNNCNGQSAFGADGFEFAGLASTTAPTAPCAACQNGFTGVDCENSPCIDAAGNPLQNCFNGSCDAGTGLCVCSAGWGGNTCECSEAGCNNGVCDSTKRNSCICNSGFGGLDCACAEASCNSPTQGSCDPAGTSGACTCLPGFGGANCACTEANCQAGGAGSGQCTPTATDGSCTCSAAFTGTDCGCNIANDCSAGLGQGSCNATGSSTANKCSCNAGFGGLTCACVDASCGSASGFGACDAAQVNACACNAGRGGADCSCAEADCNHGGSNGYCRPTTTVATAQPDCVCNAGFGGETCACEAAAQNTTNGCFGNGTCASDWDCDCNANWFGDHCNCNERLTCNFQGCNSRTGACICPDSTWGGANCQCHPVITDKRLMGGNLDANGTCNQVDSPDPSTGNRCQADGSCACGAGFNGPNCECANSPRSLGDTKKHCSGHGTCQADGSCLCDAGYNGPSCECSDATDTSLSWHCSGHGTCNADGASCTCDDTDALGHWTGGKCDQCANTWYPAPTGAAGDCKTQCIDDTNSSASAPNTGANSCNAHGTCNADGACVCEYGWTNNSSTKATDGDCDTRGIINCPDAQGAAAALQISCPAGEVICVSASSWGNNSATLNGATCATGTSCTPADTVNLLANACNNLAACTFQPSFLTYLNASASAFLPGACSDPYLSIYWSCGAAGTCTCPDGTALGTNTNCGFCGDVCTGGTTCNGSTRVCEAPSMG